MANQKATEQSIFLEALEKKGTERAAYLDRVCGTDRQLRRAIDALLDAHGRLPSLISASNMEQRAGTVDQAAICEGPGTVIGPYKLLEQIGEGGFGLVFMAEQKQPLRRKVALKVIKPGMDTRMVIARFEAERQALALMDHPNIAGVIDGGETSSGRPYFVMELVRGLPITEYCDQNQLPLRERLGLFLHVCLAVQHAHHKGVIHRDLKPSNILITEHDGNPLVKIIDFGIAKATGSQLTEKTLFTNFAQMVGTPAYMSPEQAGLSSQDIDTRSDIYSLGVLLYELLTGRTPFDKKRLKDASYDEIRRIIREEDPPKPSTRVSTLGKMASTIATQRRSDPKRLSQVFRGELDWIVMKALDKDRSRRYETASALAADVQRYLKDEPVHACPPSAWYRFRKFSRRHKRLLAMAACAAVLLLVVAGGLGYILQDRASRAARTDLEVELVLQDVDRLKQNKQWSEAMAAVNRAEGVLATGQGSKELAQRLRQTKKTVDKGLKQVQVDQKVVADLVEIRMGLYFDEGGASRQTKADFEYASAFRSCGLSIDKLSSADAAAGIRERPIAFELIAALDHWSEVRRSRAPKEPGWKHLLAIAREADGDAFRNQVRDAVEIGEAAPLLQLAKSSQVAALAPASVCVLANALKKHEAYREALALLKRAQLDNPGDFWINYELAMLYREAADEQDSAIAHFLTALAIRKSPGLYGMLFFSLARAGRHDDAQAAFQAALRLKPGNWNTYYSIAAALSNQEMHELALPYFQEAAKIEPDNNKSHNNLGFSLLNNGKPEEALAAIKKALRLKSDDASTQNNLGVALLRLGRLDEAIAAYQEALRVDPKRIVTMRNLGDALEKSGRLDEAIASYRQAISLKPEVLASSHQLAVLLRNHGRPDEEVNAVYDEAIAFFGNEIRRRPEETRYLVSLGSALRRIGRREEALDLYRTALRINPKLAIAHGNIGNVLTDQGQFEAAMAAYKTALGLDPQFKSGYCQIAFVLVRTGQLPSAIAEYRQALKKPAAVDTEAYRFALRAHPEQAVDCFFLAMVMWQRHREDVARDWYGKGVKWMAANQPADAELERFQADAARMLGVLGKQKSR
jgi:serine/threonine protein kinase/tetratricopeptide (TPR) repeat protein